MSRKSTLTSTTATSMGPATPRLSMMGVVTALALVAALGLGLIWQTDMDRRTSWSRALEIQSQAAAADAAIARAILDQAQGALGAAAQLSAGGAVPAEAAAIAARTPSSIGVAVVDPRGNVIATTDPAIAIYARTAAVAGAQAPEWAGLVKTPGGATALALTRRAGDRVLVSVIDTRGLLARADARATAIATAQGEVLASAKASPAGSVVGAFGLPAPPATDSRHALGRDPAGNRLAVGVAPILGGLTAYSAGPADRGVLGAMLSALGAALALTAPALAALFVALAARRRDQVRATDAEIELDRVRQHFRLAVDGARVGVWTLRRGDDTIELSDRLQKLVHAPDANLTISRFAALAVKEDRPNLHAAFIQAAGTGALEVSFRVNVGNSLVWIEMRGVAVSEGGDHQVLVGTAIDITPRREAELRTVAVERRMKEAIESFSGPFALFDPRKRLIAWNRAFAKAFELDADQLRRGASYDAVSTAAADAIRNERSDPDDPQSREVELASGTWLRLVERRTVEGGSIILGLDISATKRQEEEIVAKERRMRKAFEELERSEGREKELKKRYEVEKQRAEEASKAKTNFLANMSHELRTPLNAINGFSEVIAREIFGPLGHPKYKEYASDIQASGQLLLDMIGDILDMARIEAGKYNLAPRPLDPMTAIDQAVRLMRRRAQDKQLSLVVDAENVPEIHADHRAVKQILLNLLSNALKFTEAGEVRVKARRGDRGWLTLQVIDTGPGIEPEALKRLARPFEQVDAEYTRAHAGTGLGLALTKAFAELHGGTFEIKSIVGIGTTVSIGLPPRPPMSDPDQGEADEARAA
ncbi:MAG: PAS domain-containing sensor histidine kinase [Alphaproteobacteria bacterium]|nr:PAS domain-containing sensor histidine kinase [Alphaproteobacteria bacterium]